MALRQLARTLAIVLVSLLALALTWSAARTPRADAAATAWAPSNGPLLPTGARPLGPLAADTVVRATIALSPRDPGALSAYADAVSTPGSPLYHHYLSVAEFAARFGPSRAQLRRLRAALAASGLRAGPVSANRLELGVTGTAARASAALRTTLQRFAVAGRAGFSTTGSPRLPGAAARLVQAVVGLDTVAPHASVIVAPRRPLPHDLTAAANATGAGAQACAAARARATADGSFTVDQIAARYQFDALYGAGDLGRGVTVAVYELEPFSAGDVAGFQACMHTHATVSVERVDGGAGSGAGSGEAAMDVEDVIGLAPDVTVRVYEGPSSGTGAYDTYARIVSDDTARVITTSWGLCEAQLGEAAAAAEDTLFQEAAAQGQTVLASAGDQGSDDCGGHEAAVDDPASQPWVTGVGATSAQPAGDTVWNDSLGATGGGVSTLWARPAYQSAAAVAQDATDCGAAGTSCREVPDVAIDGDPNTGYAIYYRGAWVTMGGTSASTPTWAALAALADASPQCAGHPLGFANPALYGLAATAYASDFTDVTVGDNAFGRVPGFLAGPGYDMASGLGVPDAAALVGGLCGQSLSLAAPVTQRTPQGRPASVAVHASGPPASYAASGLPAGLAIDPATGTISGTPSTPGTSVVTVTATDAAGAVARATFRWVVTAVRQRAVASSGTRRRGGGHGGHGGHGGRGGGHGGRGGRHRRRHR